MPLTNATKKFIHEAKTHMENNPIDLNHLTIDDYRNMWIVFTGKKWVDVNLKDHKCNLNEESIQD